MTIDWHLFRTGQIEGLAAVSKEAKTKALVVNTIDERESLIVVPPSQYDLRRWDIDRDGHVSRCNRETGQACRGNKFPKYIMATAPKLARAKRGN